MRNILRSLALAGATVAASLVSTSAGANQQPQEQETLFFQGGDDVLVGLISQDFPESMDAFDSQGADDFEVPKGEVWRLQLIHVWGQHADTNGRDNLRSMNVTIYRDSGDSPHRPGEVIASFAQRKVKYGLRGDYTVVLPEEVKLRNGKYWLSVQGIAPSGQWAWSTLQRQWGQAALWKNPADGYQTGCTEYQHTKGCFGDIGQGVDFMFHLRGRHLRSEEE